MYTINGEDEVLLSSRRCQVYTLHAGTIPGNALDFGDQHTITIRSDDNQISMKVPRSLCEHKFAQETNPVFYAC